MSDLSELFSRDPLSYTKDDIAAIVAAMRERRHQFNSAAPRPGKPAAKPKPKVEVDLKGLDL